MLLACPAGLADSNAASAASSALADAAKSGKLKAYLSDEGIEEVTSVAVDGVKVGSGSRCLLWLGAAPACIMQLVIGSYHLMPGGDLKGLATFST